MIDQPISKIVITLLCSFLFLQSVKAQDANYWSSNYNPAGLLTPGAVIALNRDSGVMFFNPALLGYNTKNSASISGTVYQLSRVNVKDGAGTGLNMNSTSTSIIPQMVAATISFKGRHPFTVGYALTHDQLMSYQANQQRDGKLNVLSDTYSPGDEYYLGQIANQNSVGQTGGLISGGIKMSDQLALGLTAEADLRKQTFNTGYSARAIFNTQSDFLGGPPLANFESTYLASYYTLGIRFKAGLAYNMDKNHHVGLTITSPLLNLYGRASILSDNVANNLIDVSATPRDTLHLLANSRQQGLKAKYKMPFSIGAGYAYDLKKGQIFFSAEYFSKVSEYNIITPKVQTFIRGEGQEGIAIFTPDFLRFADARNSVINFGIGASYLLKPNLMGYLSLYTDFNNVNKSVLGNDFIGTAPYTSYYNVYHCQTGINIQKRKFNFRAGLILAYGTTNKYMQVVNFDHPNEDNLLLGEPTTTRESQLSAGLMFSYIYNL